jgi:UDP-N-acetylmuramoyl-tripeptide--D-alanyl-D-alanine ligase
MRSIDDAKRHRMLVQNTVFIAITGSCGKTTTKDLSEFLLRPTLRGLSSHDDGNCGSKLIDNLLRVKPDDDFYIQELGAWGPGTLDAGIGLVQPKIGVVLNVRNDHFSSFKGRKNAQAEKSKVVRVLPTTGTAILNADDPYVWEMRHWTPASVLGFGVRQESDLRACGIRCEWPDRLSFNLCSRGTMHSVETQLLGEHFVGSALAALCVAVAIGVPIEAAIERLAAAPPTPRRMSPVLLDSGVTFIRDDFKATNDSMPEVTGFIRRAQARRKIVVLGRISDHPGRSRKAYTAAVDELAEHVDILILVGERHEDLWGREQRALPNYLAEFRSASADVRLFEFVREASDYLRRELRRGDLVLLKGSGVSDHLERILLQLQTEVLCWDARCGRTIACDSCERLHIPAEPCP